MRLDYYSDDDLETMQRVSYLILLHWENDFKVISDKIDRVQETDENSGAILPN
jgi:hypothetical protein